MRTPAPGDSLARHLRPPRGDAHLCPPWTRLPPAIDVPDSLLRRAQGGELRAFEQIYRLFERPVFSLALRLLGDAETAREVLHDAMLKLFQRIGQFRHESPFWVGCARSP